MDLLKKLALVCFLAAIILAIIPSAIAAARETEPTESVEWLPLLVAFLAALGAALTVL